jgi:spermidine/putrescine transport system substrate-binding protein
MSRSARPPLSPDEAALVRLMSRGRLSRRGLLGGALGMGALLAGCGDTPPFRGATGSGSPAPAVDLSETDQVVKWANWTLYLDKDGTTKQYPTLKAFQDKTGIVPSYFEEIEDNNSYYDRIEAQLRQGKDIGRDVVVFTDWMAARLVRARWVQKLDKDKNIPNAARIIDQLKNVEFDPGRNYSLTWQSGYTGLGWNVAKYRELTGKTEMRSLDELWNPKLKGRVSVLSEMRDTIGLIMLAQGTDPSKPFTEDKFTAASAVLEKQISSGQIRSVKGNSYKDDLTSGDTVAVIAWSGDISQLNSEARAANATLTADPFGFALPESGGMLWSDNLLIPMGSSHTMNAEIMMNYYYDPTVAAKVAAYVHYICPVKGAQDEIRKLPEVDPKIAESPYIFPTPGDLANVHAFRSLTAQEEKDFSDAFRQVLGA